MIWLCGDTHGRSDIFKAIDFFQHTKAKKDDYLIILGDAAVCWRKGVGDEITKDMLLRNLNDKKYQGCDDELLIALRGMLGNNSRSVAELEKCELPSTQKYYHERLNGVARNVWHKNALSAMAGCDMVFLDPDNGLLPKSVSRGSDKSIKYVLPEEIVDYYVAGHSVVFYSHRTREKLDVYLRRFENLFHAEELKGAVIKGVSFKRGTIRDYFYILHEEHVPQVEQSLKVLLNVKWNRHFSEIQEPLCDILEKDKIEKAINRPKTKPGKTL